MTKHTRIITLGARLACLLALAVGGAHTASAQDAPGEVLVAIPETFPEIDARAIVLRDGSREVILLRADDATPEALAMSLSVLERSRARPLAPETGEMIPIIGFALEAPLPARARGRLEEVLARLDRQPLSSIGSFGAGRWIRWRAR